MEPMLPSPHHPSGLHPLQPAFFDEADDSLREMDRLLLAIEPGEPGDADDEALNSIFRCAHSVKGGAAAFGIDDVAALAHRMESLLDRWRKRQLGPSALGIELLLLCGDALRERLAQLRAGLGDAHGAADASIATLLQAFDITAREAEPPAQSADCGPRRVLELSVGPLAQPALADALVQLFNEIAELGQIVPLDDGLAVDGMRRFRLHTDCSDDELRALLGMQVPGVQFDLRASKPPAAPPPPQLTHKTATAAKSAAAAPASLRVSIDKIDRLINLAGELLIAQTALTQACSGPKATQPAALAGCLADLERPTRELQHAVMAMRMVPMSEAFSRFPRLLHDLSARLGKQLRLQTEGDAIELDKGMAEGLNDPLLHLLRNACDHGIETPDERVACGKAAIGTITLSAAHEAGSMRIEVHDDGRGLSRERLLRKARECGAQADDTMRDAQVWELAFLPGLSTADRLSEVSGRGVGMDVVRRNISALGGTVHIESTAGVGTRVSMCVPLTLAVIDAVSVAIGDECYVLPLAAVVEAVPARTARVQRTPGGLQRLQWRDQTMPLLDLHRLFELPAVGNVEAREHDVFIVVQADGQRAAVGVDHLLGQQQVAVKKLDAALCQAGLASAATILGDGHVALILDAAALVRWAWAQERRTGKLQGTTC